MEIVIRSIPQEQQRYVTLGDYWDDGDMQHIRVTTMPDRRYELLIALHELVESELCRNRGIPEPDIMAFDLIFEGERAAGLWTDEEPGNDPRAPYRSEHQIAESMERQFASYLGVDWVAYESYCAAL